MPSSSSAKKVARVAAKSGTNTKGAKGTWFFWAGVGALVVIGVGLVVFARDKNGGSGDNTTPPRAKLTETTPSDHWHNSFAIEVCGKELPALSDASPDDPLGIHTHGDGLIHIHPFVTAAAGNRATMSKFFTQVGLTVTDDGFKLPDGKVYKAGETTCEGKPTELVMAHWKVATTAADNKPDKIITSDFGGIRFTENFGAYTLALVPKGSRDIAAPSASANIKELGAADGGDTTGGASTVPATQPEVSVESTAPTSATTAPKKP